MNSPELGLEAFRPPPAAPFPSDLGYVDEQLRCWQQKLDSTEHKLLYGYERPWCASNKQTSACVTPNLFNPMNPLLYWKAKAQMSEEELSYLEKVKATKLQDVQYWQRKHQLICEILKELRSCVSRKAQPSPCDHVQNPHSTPLKRQLHDLSSEIDDLPSFKRTKASHRYSVPATTNSNFCFQKAGFALTTSGFGHRTRNISPPAVPSLKRLADESGKGRHFGNEPAISGDILATLSVPESCTTDPHALPNEVQPCTADDTQSDIDFGIPIPRKIDATANKTTRHVSDSLTTNIRQRDESREHCARQNSEVHHEEENTVGRDNESKGRVIHEDGGSKTAKGNGKEALRARQDKKGTVSGGPRDRVVQSNEIDSGEEDSGSHYSEAVNDVEDEERRITGSYYYDGQGRRSQQAEILA